MFMWLVRFAKHSISLVDLDKQAVSISAKSGKRFNIPVDLGTGYKAIAISGFSSEKYEVHFSEIYMKDNEITGVAYNTLSSQVTTNISVQVLAVYSG